MGNFLWVFLGSDLGTGGGEGSRGAFLKAGLLVAIFGGEGRSDLTEDHFAAEVFKIRGHGEGNAKALGEEFLGRQFAHVDTHADAVALFEVATFLDVDGAAVGFAVGLGDRIFPQFAGTNEPFKQARRKPGIGFADPLGGGKELTDAPKDGGGDKRT